MCWKVPPPYEDMKGNVTDAILPTDWTWTDPDVEGAVAIVNGAGAPIEGYTFTCKASYLSAGLGALALAAWL